MVAGSNPRDEVRRAARRLLKLARPYLRRQDRDGLAARLSEEWSPECLSLLLEVEDPEILDMVLTCLGLTADVDAAPSVARYLKHADPCVVAAAEDALWSIWFRAGGPMAQAALVRIVRSIRAGDADHVIAMLAELIRAHPDYAEAYHQRSQAFYLQGSYALALRDARRAARLNPLHFSALANEAHALAALGRPREALEAYRSVQRLHPSMAGVREAIDHLDGHVVAVAV